MPYADPKELPNKQNLSTGLKLRSMWLKYDANNAYPNLDQTIHDPTATPATLNPDIILATNVKDFRYVENKVDGGKTQLQVNATLLLNENNVKVQDFNNMMEAQVDRDSHFIAGYATLEDFEPNFDTTNPGYNVQLLCRPSGWTYNPSILT
jgi:hypothetical protein